VVKTLQDKRYNDSAIEKWRKIHNLSDPLYSVGDTIHLRLSNCFMRNGIVSFISDNRYGHIYYIVRNERGNFVQRGSENLSEHYAYPSRQILTERTIKYVVIHH
jgi:hypothetical protein